MLDGEILDDYFGKAVLQIPEGIAWREKIKKCSVGSVWRDEMKRPFEMLKVGMTWCAKDSVLLMKNWPNKGTFADPWAACVIPDHYFAEWFVRLCMFDFAVGNGDRHSGNILVLSEHLLLPIDEAMKVRPMNKWSMVLNKTGRAKAQKAFAEASVNRMWLHEYVGQMIDYALPQILAIRDKYSPYITVEEYKHLDLALPVLLRGETAWLDKTFRLIGVEDMFR